MSEPIKQQWANSHTRERGIDLTHIVQMALRIYKGLYAHSKGLGGIREIVTEGTFQNGNFFQIVSK